MEKLGRGEWDEEMQKIRDKVTYARIENPAVGHFTNASVRPENRHNFNSGGFHLSRTSVNIQRINTMSNASIRESKNS
jgi:hypothetical protein